MLIPLGVHIEKVCTKCHEEVMDWVGFPHLEGQPVICERCIVEALGLGRRGWTAAFLTGVAAYCVRAAARPSWWRRLLGA